MKSSPFSSDMLYKLSCLALSFLQLACSLMFAQIIPKSIYSIPKPDSVPEAALVIKEMDMDPILYYKIENGLNAPWIELHIKNGKKNGLEKEYYKNGKLYRKTFFIDGVPDSIETIFWENGNIGIKRNYNHGDLDGKQKLFNIVGELLVEQNYKNNLLDGQEIEYFANGKIHRKVYYVMGSKNGDETHYWENGKINAKVNYFFGKITNHIVTAYDENERVIAKAEFQNGFQNGNFTQYCDNGNIFSISEYKDDKLNGWLKKFNCSDKVVLECEYKDGELDGIVKEYQTANNWLTFGFKKGKEVSLADLVCDNCFSQKHYSAFEGEVLLFADKMPRFIYGNKCLNEYLDENLILTDTLKKDTADRTVYCSFVINKNGELKGISILKGINDQTNQMAMKALELTDGLWEPGTMNGITANIKMNIGIKFKRDYDYSSNVSWDDIEPMEKIKVGKGNGVQKMDENRMKKARIYATRAEQKLLEGKLKYAEKYYEIALRFEPLWIDNYYNLGLVRAKYNNMDEACKAWKVGFHLGDKTIEPLLIKYCNLIK